MNNIKKELELIELDELIEGINRFTAISRLRVLTTDETNRRQLYRQEYIQRMRRNLTATLDNTDIEFADEDKNGSNC